MFKVPSRQELLELFNLIDKYDVKVFTILQYLTGSRPEELCRYSILDKEGRVIGKKKSIRAMDFWVEQNMQKEWLIVRKRVLKKRGKKMYVLVPILFDKNSFDGKLARIVWDFLPNNLEAEVFPFSRGYVYKYQVPIYKRLKDEQGWDVSPKHIMRHIRSTHLYQYYGFSGTEKKEFFGWENELPNSMYTHLEKKDLMKKMIH